MKTKDQITAPRYCLIKYKYDGEISTWDFTGPDGPVLAVNHHRERWDQQYFRDVKRSEAWDTITGELMASYPPAR